MKSQALSDAAAARRNGWIHIALWIVQGLLAAAFGFAGVLKLTAPIPELAAQMGWPGDIPGLLVRFIGLSELAAALGLVLPAALRIRPMLTPLAAAGLVVVMTLAAGFHGMRGEPEALPINLALGALAAFVAWGRFRKVPIASR